MSSLLRPEVEASYQAQLSRAAKSRHAEYCQYFDRLEVSVPVKGRKAVDVAWQQGIAVEKLNSCLEVRCCSPFLNRD